MFKCSMEPGLGPPGKLESLCVGSFKKLFWEARSILYKLSLTDPGKKTIFIYISPAASNNKFKWVVISSLAFLLSEVIWNFYCQGTIYDIVQVC